MLDNKILNIWLARKYSGGIRAKNILSSIVMLNILLWRIYCHRTAHNMQEKAVRLSCSMELLNFTQTPCSSISSCLTMLRPKQNPLKHGNTRIIEEQTGRLTLNEKTIKGFLPFKRTLG